MIFRIRLPEVVFEYVSPAASQVFGCNPDEFYQNSKLQVELLPADWKTYFHDRWIELSAGKRPEIFEFPIIHKVTGEKRWMHQSNSWITDQADVLTALQGRVTDVTDRVDAVSALQESEERFKRLFEDLGDAVFVTQTGGSASGRILEVNSAAVKQTGYTREELLSMNIATDLAVTDSADISFDEWDNRLAEGERVISVEKKRRKDGTEYWTEVLVTPIDFEGRQCGLSINHDITVRKRAEQALRVSEQKFRELTDLLPQIIYEADLKGNLTFANKQAYTVLGYSEDDLEGGHNVLHTLIPEDRDRAWENMLTILKGRPVENPEFTLTTRDGSTFPALIYSSPIMKNDKAVGMRGIIVDITQRKQLEQEMIRLTNAVRMSSDSIVLSDLKGRIVDVNQATLDICGVNERDELIGKNTNELIAPEDREKSLISTEEVLEKGFTKGVEYNILRGDGGRIPVEMSITQLKDAVGKPIGYVSVSRDITERKRTELIQSTQYNITRAMVTAANLEELLAIVSTELSKVMDSRNFILALYDKASDLLHAPFKQDLKDTIPDYWEPGKTMTGMVIQQKQPVVLKKADINQLIKEGSLELIGTLPEVWLGIPLFKKTVIIGALVIQSYETPDAYDETSIHILKVIASEIENYISRKQSESERERLNAAIEQSAESILITDSAGVIQYVNPFFEQVTGYSREEVVGQNPRILKSEKQSQLFYKELWDTISNGRVWRGRIINRRKDAVLFTEECTISPVFDAAGTITNYVAVKHDITREQSLERQIQQAQKMESIGRLAGGVAHDFNNMLSVIMGYSELALAKLDSQDKLYSDIMEINKAGQRSADLTMQLLAFSRKQTISPRVLDLNDTINNMLKMLRRLIGEDINLVWMPGASLWKVYADPVQIDQILANLCVNARDAIDGSGKVIIETSSVSLDEDFCQLHVYARPGDYVLLTITDDGSGMDATTLSRLFEPFFTTKAEGEGTGLGLATVYGAVKQNEGLINVYSEPGQGTTFKLHFPRYQGVESDEVEGKKKELPTGRGELIMLVEDEAAILKMAHTLIENMGYTVIAVDNPHEALRLAAEEKRRIELLITDVVMPGLNGKELAAQLQAQYPHLKTLFMSGYTADVIAQRGILDKAVNFISKPFTKTDLAVKIYEVLNER